MGQFFHCYMLLCVFLIVSNSADKSIVRYKYIAFGIKSLVDAIICIYYIHKNLLTRTNRSYEPIF